jgi:hypothetical protein
MNHSPRVTEYSWRVYGDPPCYVLLSLRLVARHVVSFVRSNPI